MLEFYIRSLAGVAFLLGLMSLSNLHFIGLAFFYSRDVFGIGYCMTAIYLNIEFGGCKLLSHSILSYLGKQEYFGKSVLIHQIH